MVKIKIIINDFLETIFESIENNKIIKISKDQTISVSLISLKTSKVETDNFILITVLIAGIIWVSTKYFGLFADADKDGIPDEVEETVEKAVTKVKNTTKEVKRRAKRVKQELGDIGDAVKEVGNQVGDVGKAIKGKPRTGRKKKNTK